ncbi:cytochrome b/b6 domain-containing protein [Agromyces ramosus]|uniref:Thiosulfate reductase cytochrome b subunit n=1 Tax=Agromyces ramosus TaxID=33879 RepID=A0ABU0RC87_9MICO|nr:cytochrome b/b6 domain-containing protein [Agromyces ramosus]MDQ0895683.1 thiosulfate reductase cytochrome b subunit [Agromyces ramosus]
MAAHMPTARRGLPRQRGGGAWPPVGEAPDDLVAAPAEPLASAEAPVATAAAPSVAAAPVVVAPASHARLRSGLPRATGGPPWPEAGEAPRAADPEVTDAAAVAPPASVGESRQLPAAPQPAAPQPAPAAARAAASVSAVRRGLPRVAAGEPWPSPSPVVPVAVSTAAPAPVVASVPAAPVPATAVPPAPAPPIAPPPAPSAAAPPAAVPPAPVPTAAASAPAASATQASATTASGWKRYGTLTPRQWVGASVVGILAIIGAATIVVQLTRWFLGLDFMQDFLATYPGEVHLPEGAPVGLPAWLGWQHFFNAFLIVLIIRSGLQMRTEKRPVAFWTPRWSKLGRKISLNLWFHQALDVLWLVNGVIFVVLLFATGQWMRVVPTSWEYLPNAVSAGLQYLSLDWPLENGWVNYNSLQVLAYFATIFIAAPLAVATGVRMSGVWPKNAATLTRVYPVEWARAVHFPVMLYFVAFIVVHVVLVFTTGMLRNLNHMYAAQDADNWLGFWIFVTSLVVIAAAWVAARPTVLAPIAGVFGKVGR